MAKILNKDPITYERERECFIQELRHFHDTRGTPFRKIPKINGHEVDLYLLYVLVTAHGGWVKVNGRNEWDPLVDQFNLPKQCVNSGVGLKQIYLRFLDRYEKVHYLGEDADRGSDDDEESRHKRWSARALHSVPLTYNYHQHNVAEGLRSYNGLSVDLFRSSDYDRLALSLISPLPNEQDFAINVCMLLSNEGKHTLRLDKCPRLVDLLLAHAGVFNHVSLRELFNEVYSQVRHHSMHQFWMDTLREDVAELTDERKFQAKAMGVKKDVIGVPQPGDDKTPNKTHVKHKRIEERLVAIEVNLVNSDLSSEVINAANKSVVMENETEDLFAEGEDGLLTESRPRLKIEASDYELFCVGRSFGTQDYLGQRVLQIATILRNLSFSEENISIVSKNVTFLRFLLLCAGSRWNTLHQLGLDMLGNVALEVLVEDPNSNRLAACLISTVSNGIISQDRSVVVSCLEVLNKLSQKDENEDVMLRCIEQQVYNRVCQFLTLHDIMLLIQTLECLYSLSSLGERACNCIARVHGCIDTLVALITVEAQSYGPKACILMRVVETAPAGTTLVNTSNPTSTTTTMTAVPSPAVISTSATPVIKHTGIPPTPVKPPHHHHVNTFTPTSKSTNSVPSQTVIGAPQPAVATPVSVSQQQQHAQQQVAQENEQFALSWLRASCELSVGGKMEQAELYRQYLAACGRIGRRGVIAPLHFPRCVRSVFGGSVGPNMHKSSVAGGESTSYYEGIKVRAQAIPRSPLAASTVTPVTLDTSLPLSLTQPSSPILKAQLSAPPKPAAKPGPDKVVSHPHLTQALLGGGDGVKEGGSPSSLIKSLLASKVNTSPPTEVSMTSMMPVQCATPTIVTNKQVTQRQQRLLQQQQQQLKKDPTPVPPTCNSVVKKAPCKPVDIKPKLSRINGAKVAIQMEVAPKDTMDNGPVLSPQGNGRGCAPLPPLAPLSSGPHQRPELEDSNSTNNSLASSSGVRVNHTSTDDGENSLTSFEGILLNGIPPPLDVDERECKKTLMLADLLEKKVDKKDHPLLNGVLGKELRIGDKGLELVENHVEEEVARWSGKRAAGVEEGGGDAKRHCPETNGEEGGGASAAAANLYAALAASTLEDEDMTPPPQQQVYGGEQQVLMPRQIIMSQPQSQVLITPSGQITLHAAGASKGVGQIVQASGVASRTQVMLTQGSSGQFILSQAPHNSVQIGNTHYVVAQQQTALVQGQTQTVLVAQTQQQQGTGAKTIIILQPQGGNNATHQKVMVTQQGQPVVVTQVPRPILQTPASSIPPALVPTSTKSASLSPRPITPAPNPNPTVPKPPITTTPILTPVSKATVIKATTRPVPVSTGVIQSVHGNTALRVPVTTATETVDKSNGVAVRTFPPAKNGTPSQPAQPSSHTSSQMMTPTPTPTIPHSSGPKTPVIDPSAFLCEWRGCMRSFKSANEVYMHACEAHCPSGSQEIQCLWERCDAMKRKRFSLMTHLYDRHCNADVLRMMAVRRKQLSVSGRSEIPPPQPPPPHPGYAPNAAFHAIKRHALEFVNPKELMRPAKPGPPASAPLARTPEQDDNEGPVTKSIRLTSSLILRNLVIYSTNGRRTLRSYEPHLASIALSNVESSRTIAQVLYDMNQQSSGR